MTGPRDAEIAKLRALLTEAAVFVRSDRDHWLRRWDPGEAATCTAFLARIDAALIPPTPPDLEPTP